MFEKLSPTIAAILAIPDGKKMDDPTREGSEKYPLFLEGMTTQAFEGFLVWVYRVEWDCGLDSDSDEAAAERETALADLLKLSDIEVHPRKEISNISLDDISRMGIHVYWILVRGKERFDIEVRRTANVEPYMGRDPTWQCENHSLCLKVWRKLWWTKIGRKLLHPDYPLTSDDILWEVKRLKQKGLTEACRNDMARQILIKEVTFCDERVVPAVAQAIVAYHKSL
ncbi:hypothetical protein C8J57DRAFT_1225949 [Mycena rebaudengoi]|nr:hypothetical protein C8J57DRAFT_1225949 [Mycena rebaudengoi]